MGFSLSRAAEADLITLYLESAALFGVAQADVYHAQFEAKFAFIAANPKAVRERLEIEPPVRCAPCGSHLIIYVINEAGGVTILRVRHGREDWTRE